jgi:hypothetical protein
MGNLKNLMVKERMILIRLIFEYICRLPCQLAFKFKPSIPLWHH